MEVGKVERYVNDLMTVSGIEREGKEQSVGLALYHLLMSAALRDLMDDDDKELFKALAKKVQYFFCSSLNLKERKGKQKKEKFPPNPLIKEKQKKGKEEKTNPTVGDGNSDAEKEGKGPEEAPSLKGHSVLSATLEARRAEFMEEVRARGSAYQPQLLNDFYFYWSEENPATGKMRFEEQRTWNIDNRLKRWVRNQYSVADTAAAIRMKRLRKQQEKEQMAEQVRKDEAAQREQADAEREAQTERDRQLAGGLEEQIAANPDGFLARVQRERQKREDKK